MNLSPCVILFVISVFFISHLTYPTIYDFFDPLPATVSRTRPGDVVFFGLTEIGLQWYMQVTVKGTSLSVL